MIIILEIKGNYIYLLIKNIVTISGIGKSSVYGIRIIGGNTAYIPDISNDYISVRNLFDLIVEEELYPEHLYDVVEDYLCEMNLFNVIDIRKEDNYESTHCNWNPHSVDCRRIEGKI